MYFLSVAITEVILISFYKCCRFDFFKMTLQILFLCPVFLVYQGVFETLEIRYSS